MTETNDRAVEAAREALIADLLGSQPGDEAYGWDTTLGKIEVYRIRRAVRAALAAFDAAKETS
jgi:hypothetical protein